MSDRPIVHVELPYDLTLGMLQLDPVAQAETDVDHPMTYLVDSVSWDDDEALEIIFRGAIVCKTANPEATFAQCLETSIIWYAG